MARVLVVGGAGYIGGALTDLLMESRHDFRVYDSLLYEESYRKPVDFVIGDVRDMARLAPHLRWADVVVWLAALVGDGACALDPDFTAEINAHAVRNLVENYNGRIIFTSTCSVYGANDGLLDETSALNPLSVYASTKMEAEEHLKSAENALIFRLGTLFGVGDNYSRIRMDLVVNILTAKAITQNKISVFGGAQFRPLLHVRDVAAAVLQNIETQCTGLYNLHAVNVRILDLANEFVHHFPSLEVQRTEMKFEDSRNYRVTSEKAMAAFGFEPRYTVSDGIEQLKGLILEGRIRNVRAPRHFNHQHLKPFLESKVSPIGYEVSSGILQTAGPPRGRELNNLLDGHNG